MAASTEVGNLPTSNFVLNNIAINILKALGHDKGIPSEASIKIPLFYPRTSHKCDLCIPIIQVDLPHAHIPLVLFSEEMKNLRIAVNLEKLQEELPNLGKSWALPVKFCQYSEHSFCVYFDRKKALSVVLPDIIAKGNKYGFFPSNGKRIFLTRDTSNKDGDKDLLQLRIEVAFQSLINVFRNIGYIVMVDETNPCLQSTSDFSVHVSSKSTCKTRPPGSYLILCGSVVSFKDGIKTINLASKSYYRQKEEKLKQVEKNRELLEGNDIQIEKLSRAEAIAELLFVKLHDSVSVHVDEHRCLSDHKGAAFLLYNHVRLLSLRRKYEEMCNQGIYPELPAIYDVNFGLLLQDEEWDIFLLVLRFPLWLLACVSNVKQGKASLHHVLIGLDKLCRIFSVYYRRVRILTEPRPHLLPVLFARLYLMQSVESVLKNGLSILGIHTLDYM